MIWLFDYFNCMKIQILEKVDDDYINLYEIWIFIRVIEYNTIIDQGLFKYRINPYIERKTWFVFL